MASQLCHLPFANYDGLVFCAQNLVNQFTMLRADSSFAHPTNGNGNIRMKKRRRYEREWGEGTHAGDLSPDRHALQTHERRQRTPGCDTSLLLLPRGPLRADVPREGTCYPFLRQWSACVVSIGGIYGDLPAQDMSRGPGKPMVIQLRRS